MAYRSQRGIDIAPLLVAGPLRIINGDESSVEIAPGQAKEHAISTDPQADNAISFGSDRYQDGSHLSLQFETINGLARQSSLLYPPFETTPKDFEG